MARSLLNDRIQFRLLHTIASGSRWCSTTCSAGLPPASIVFNRFVLFLATDGPGGWGQTGPRELVTVGMVNAPLTICVARFMGRSMKRGATP
jgi:hypothetical protein